MCPLPNDHLICRNILHQLYNLSSCPPTHAFLCSNNPPTMIYFKLCSLLLLTDLRNCDPRNSRQHLHQRKTRICHANNFILKWSSKNVTRCMTKCTWIYGQCHSCRAVFYAHDLQLFSIIKTCQEGFVSCTNYHLPAEITSQLLKSKYFNGL